MVLMLFPYRTISIVSCFLTKLFEFDSFDKARLNKNCLFEGDAQTELFILLEPLFLAYLNGFALYLLFIIPFFQLPHL